VHEDHLDVVHPGGTVMSRGINHVFRWWTRAGLRANACLAATLSGIADPVQQIRDTSIRLREDLTLDLWKSGSAGAIDRLCLPDIDDRTVRGLKFSAALPQRLAVATLAARLADTDGAASTLGENVRWSAS